MRKSFTNKFRLSHIQKYIEWTDAYYLWTVLYIFDFFDLDLICKQDARITIAAKNRVGNGLVCVTNYKWWQIAEKIILLKKEK